MVMDTENK